MRVRASRRTDIPAYYMKWFLKKLEDGFVTVSNPFNKNQKKIVSLSKSDVDLIVFWTRDATALLKNIDTLNSYQIPYYVNYTITGYDCELEPNSKKLDKSIDTISKLSDAIGKSRVIWRYDPIIINANIDLLWHKENFSYIIRKLNNKIGMIVISFVDEYKKNKKNLHSLGVLSPSTNHQNYVAVAEVISKISDAYNVPLQSCCEELLLNSSIPAGSCVDPNIIYPNTKKHRLDPNQRKACKCYPSVDIGEYNTCFMGCMYCYATSMNSHKM